MTRIMKRIICMTIVILLVIACASPAFADNQVKYVSPEVKQRFGAWVASALMAGQIMVQSVAGPVAKMYSYLSDPFDVSYQYTDTYYQDWMDKNKIVIDKNHVQIDGVWYDNVWLSHDAADKFRTNALDFKTAYNIASNSNGIFASGTGDIDGIPVFNDGTRNRSQYINITGATGTWQISPDIIVIKQRDQIGKVTNSDGTRYNDFPMNYGESNRIYLYTDSYNDTYYNINKPSDISGYNRRMSWLQFNNEPFEYDWVSQDIDLDPLENDEGLSILVPHDEMEPWYDDNPGFNPQINPEINIDVDSPDFPDVWHMVDTLIDTIDLLLDNLPDGAVKYEPMPDPVPVPPAPEPDPYPDPEPVPYPDPEPEPGTTIPDIDWTDLFKTIKNIYDAISQGNVIKQVIANINTDIRNIMDNIRWQIEQIREQIGDIADKIIHGNKDWFKDIVDAIKLPFLPWINAFKTGVGIWHYVVEWVTYISAPFSYFFNITASINYNLVLPIYALIAGSIVIAIYRRFGR